MIWGWIKFKDKFWLTSVGRNLVRRSTHFLTRFTVITSTPVLFYNKQNKLNYFFPSGHGNEFCNLIGS